MLLLCIRYSITKPNLIMKPTGITRKGAFYKQNPELDKPEPNIFNKLQISNSKLQLPNDPNPFARPRR